MLSYQNRKSHCGDETVIKLSDLHYGISFTGKTVILIYWIGTQISPSLTHWGWVTHICVSKLTTTGSDNGLSPDRRQAIIWTNAGLLLIGPLGTNFSEILIQILTFSFKKMHLKVLSVKRRPFCLSLNVLTHLLLDKMAALQTNYRQKL